MSARDFLVEIGTEELPPKSLLALATAFAEGIGKGLTQAGLSCKSIEKFATPRRLAVRVRRLAERQPDRAIERRGPPLKAAFDAQGAPTQAALAFAKSCGVDVAALEHVETPKGAWLVHRGTEAGAATMSLLPGIVQAALDALPIARRMRWGAGEAQFVRPVHWVLMLFGRDVVPCSILDVAAGNLTYGHRFMAPKPLRITAPAAYVRTLQKRGRVLADIDERRETIRSGVAAAAAQLGGNAVISAALLDEVTALVEWPVPLAGRFDERFLELPAEVPIATMQDHQRYFPVRDAQGGLMPWFITVANLASQRPGADRCGQRAGGAPSTVGRGVLLVDGPAAAPRRAPRRIAPRHVPDAARLVARQDRARAGTRTVDRGRDRRRSAPRGPCRSNWRSATSLPRWWANSRNCRA